MTHEQCSDCGQPSRPPFGGLPSVACGQPLYAETGPQTDARHKAFTYHPPGGTQTGRYELLRECARNMAELLNHNCPPSRELALAQTHLQQVVMWANAAIACNEPRPEAK